MKTEYTNEAGTRVIRIDGREDGNGYWKTYEYNAAGLLIRREERNGTWEVFVYNKEGKLWGNKRSSGFWCKRGYNYYGNCTRIEDSTGYWQNIAYRKTGQPFWTETKDGGKFHNNSYIPKKKNVSPV